MFAAWGRFVFRRRWIVLVISALLLVGSGFIAAQGGKLESGGFIDRVGRDKVFPSKDVAIRSIYARLDPEICRTCKARIFIECQETLPDGSRRGTPR